MDSAGDLADKIDEVLPGARALRLQLAGTEQDLKAIQRILSATGRA